MATVLPDGFSNKLTAVNILLQSISEAPVSSLDTSTSVDVASAVQTLDEMDRALQAKGWHWNREEDYEIAPDPTTGEVALPGNYLWVGPAYWTSTGAPAKVAERARRLYNRDTHSFSFPEAVKLDLVLKLPWDDIPEYARQAIITAAVEVFQVRLQGTSIIQRTSEKAVQVATAVLEQREDEAEEQSNVGGNRSVSHLLSTRGVRRRY